MTGTKDEMI